MRVPEKRSHIFRSYNYKDGVKPCPDKVKAVKEFPIPKTVRNVQQFLGLANYYRRFIKNFSLMGKPLFNVLKK